MKTVVILRKQPLCRAVIRVWGVLPGRDRAEKVQRLNAVSLWGRYCCSPIPWRSGTASALRPPQAEVGLQTWSPGRVTEAPQDRFRPWVKSGGSRGSCCRQGPSPAQPSVSSWVKQGGEVDWPGWRPRLILPDGRPAGPAALSSVHRDSFISIQRKHRTDAFVCGADFTEVWRQRGFTEQNTNT